jgi:hypothetical protein
MKAMILLAVNAGLGQSDIAELPKTACCAGPRTASEPCQGSHFCEKNSGRFLEFSKVKGAESRFSVAITVEVRVFLIGTSL